MSDASFRNLAASVRERDRRIGLSLASPGMAGVAQAGYLMPSWDAFYGSQREQAGPGGYRLSGAGSSLEGDPAGSTERPGEADSMRSLAINDYLARVTDEKRARAQAENDMAAHNQAVRQAASDKSTADRALAIANTPGVSATGRSIAQREDGSYTTLRPNPAEPQPPVNRQQLAAQMAPGVIAPPAPAPPVTYGQPVKATVTRDGKQEQVFVRPGSDGITYDMSRRPIDAADIAQDAPPAVGARPLTQTAEAQMIGKLAGDWGKANQTSAEMERQFQIMRSGIDRFDADPNSASQAVLVTFQKMLDPESVVRESEYARSSQGISVLNRMKGYAERLAKGGAGVPKAQLEEMVKTAQQFKENTKDAPAGARRRLEKTADRYGIPHELIFSDAPGAAPAGGGAVGGMVMLQPPGGGPARPIPADQADHYIALGAKRVGG